MDKLVTQPLSHNTDEECWVMVFHRAALLSISCETLPLKMTLRLPYKTLQEPMGIEDLMQQIVFFIVRQ